MWGYVVDRDYTVQSSTCARAHTHTHLGRVRFAGAIADADDEYVQFGFEEGEEREAFGSNVFSRADVPTENCPREEDARTDDVVHVGQPEPLRRYASDVKVFRRVGILVVLLVLRKLLVQDVERDLDGR